MIDVENLVFDKFYNGVTAERQDVNITRGFVEESAEYPMLAVHEVNNVPVMNTNTDDCAENYTRVTYEVEAFSDSKDTARSECRELLKLGDSVMQGMKFRRTFMSEPRNILRTVWSAYARYTLIVRAGITVGNDTVFQVYRR